MDFLIKKSDGSTAKEFPGNASMVTIPGTSKIMHTAGDPPHRPLNVGDDHVLIRATEIDEDVDRPTQKHGPKTVVVDVANETVTVTRPAIPKTTAELMEDVKNEAERRIADGTMVGGVALRCDDRSIARIHGVMVAAQRGAALPITFKTAAGDTVVIATLAEAEALFDAASSHVAAMLGASSVLQDSIQAMDETAIAALDVSAAAHW